MKLLFLLIFLVPSLEAISSDFRVYQVYQGLSLGGSEQVPQKDYYISMGTAHGLQVGALLQVFRRTPSYDLLAEKFHKDLKVPVALIKVIHAETYAAIARLEKLLPVDQAPSVTPRAVMVGDFVQLQVEMKEN